MQSKALKIVFIWFLSLSILYVLNLLGFLNTSILISNSVFLLLLAILSILLISIFIRNTVFPFTNNTRKFLPLVFLVSVLLWAIGLIFWGSIIFAYIGIYLSTLISLIYYIERSIYSSFMPEKNEYKDSKSIFKEIYIWMFFIFFLFIRIYVIFRYQAGFLDEYLHIFSGASLIDDSILDLYHGIEYYRGVYVTVLSAVMHYFFGFSYYAQKFIPLFIGAINFFLFNNLAKKSISNDYVHKFVLLAYTLAPLVVFNHTYIRTYVFYEMFAYIGLILAAKIIKAYTENNIRNLILHIVIGLIFTTLLLLSREVEVLLFIAIPYIYIGFTILLNLNLSAKLFNIGKYAIRSWHALLSLIPIGLLVLKYIDLIQYLSTFFSGQLSHGAGSLDKYIQFFLIDNFAFTALFLTLFFIGIYKRVSSKAALIFTLMTLFLIHQIITPDYRTIRGIFYFFPLFILGVGIVVDSFSIHKSLLFAVVLSSLALTPIFTVSQYFSPGPHIPREIDNFPFIEYYDSVKSICEGRKIISMMHSNYISNFYDLRPDYVIFLRENYLSTDVRYYMHSNGRYYQSMDRVPVISQKSELINILNETNSCILVSREFRHTSLYITGDDYAELFSEYTPYEIGSLKILRK